MKTKVLLVGSTPEVMNLMHMALAEDVRFEVAGATSHPANVLDKVQQLTLDAIVFHETDRSCPEWMPVFDVLRRQYSDVELVELAAEPHTTFDDDETPADCSCGTGAFDRKHRLTVAGCKATRGRLTTGDPRSPDHWRPEVA